MKNYWDTLKSSARFYTRNPLGIIALFISFIYGVAGLVLKFSGELEYALKAPLVWFLVIFPVIVLMVFSELVVNHHKKLYGPMDYRNDKSFLDTIPIDEKIEQISSEFDENQLESNDIQPLSKNQQIKNSLLAEELFIKFFSNIFSVNFEKNVRFHSLEGVTEFDAVGQKDKKVIAMEVKYTSDGRISDSIIAKQVARFMMIFSNLNKFPNASSFLAVLGIVKDDSVTGEIFNAERRARLFDKLPYRINVIEYTLQELKDIHS